MHVVHVTSVHPWDDVRIFHRQCRSLAATGHRVSLVAARGPEPREATTHGVHVHLLRSPTGRWDRMVRLAPALMRAARALEPDIIHFHDPELLPFGARLPSGVRVVYDVHEDVAEDILDKPWLPAPLRRTAARSYQLVERRCLRRIDGIVAATPYIGGLYAGREVALAQNFPIRDDLACGGPPHAVRSPHVVYVGGLGAARGTFEMLEGFRRVRSPGARLLVVGDFDDAGERREIEAVAAGDPRIEFRGRMPRPEVRTLLPTCSVGVALYRATGNYVRSQPNKLFEYMAAGVPAVATGFPLWREFVEGSGCGVCVDPTDALAVAEAIDRLLADVQMRDRMAAAGRQAVRERYCWEHEFEAVLGLYGRLLDA
ncbi:MAG: glycosyltransferase family 4 protein [Phycisphaerales bacterium]|nr:glycosyltransferase family 4 protein [Phycisphaerales bacterium]